MTKKINGSIKVHIKANLDKFREALEEFQEKLNDLDIDIEVIEAVGKQIESNNGDYGYNIPKSGFGLFPRVYISPEHREGDMVMGDRFLVPDPEKSDDGITLFIGNIINELNLFSRPINGCVGKNNDATMDDDGNLLIGDRDKDLVKIEKEEVEEFIRDLRHLLITWKIKEFRTLCHSRES
jgi:hypothetical protein